MDVNVARRVQLFSRVFICRSSIEVTEATTNEASDENWCYDAIDQSKAVLPIFFDPSAAFDTVDQNALFLEKLFVLSDFCFAQLVYLLIN